ncbi:MAG: hypothetical protein Q8O29_14745 [Polaromonas sp.]|uniref:hypothetical protein n=1 Tax=Polaromonas sp. TaxID=1869339 RepID=UPI0027376FBA|nr:hypothetical protein [Polaromonas sp.]MDP2819494.1 hypothetical protein [Polaromonas sp.]
MLAFSGPFPQGGVLVWGGAHVAPGLWLRYARFGRIIVQRNLASWERLFALMNLGNAPLRAAMGKAGLRQAEHVHGAVATRAALEAYLV